MKERKLAYQGTNIMQEDDSRYDELKKLYNQRILLMGSFILLVVILYKLVKPHVVALALNPGASVLGLIILACLVFITGSYAIFNVYEHKIKIVQNQPRFKK